MKKNNLYLLVALTFLCSCWQDARFKGYSESDSGLYYKLQSIGDGKRSPKFGDYLQLRITYKTSKDSIFLDSYSNNDIGLVILPFNHSSFKGSFEEGLMTMNEGDSVSFIVNADSLFKKIFNAELPYFLNDTSLVKMDVKLYKILNTEQYNAELAHYQDVIEDRDIEEQRKLQSFLDTNQSNFSQMDNGLYYLPIKQGVGDVAERGDLVKVNYKGYFLSGKPFESTYDRGQPLEFTIGQQGQVIKGLEYAISLLNEGAKAKFIIPSRLAFGKAGSSTGIVPPYSTLVYEIELLTLTKNNN